jgi:hypothetical protein
VIESSSALADDVLRQLKGYKNDRPGLQKEIISKKGPEEALEIGRGKSKNNNQPVMMKYWVGAMADIRDSDGSILVDGNGILVTAEREPTASLKRDRRAHLMHMSIPRRYLVRI